MQRESAIALVIVGSAGLMLAGILPPVLGILFLCLAFVAACAKPAHAAASHGSARLATYQDALKGGLLADDGLILGRSDLLDGKQRQKRAKLLRLRQFTHLATIAPTGKGKGVSVVIPNLLIYPHPMFVVDVKNGENFTLTASYRKRRFKQRVFRFDPYGVCGPGGNGLNPCDFIDDKADDFLDQCRDLANMLVIRLGTEQDPHWNDSAELIICAFIAFVCACSKHRSERSLQTVRKLLSSREAFAEAVTVMQRISSHHGVIARLGGQLTMFQDRELGSVLTTVQRHTQFLDSPPVARATSETTFDPRWLREPEGATFYLVLPTERLASLPGLIRMILGTSIRVLARGTPSEARPVVFLLDEAAQLGRMQALEEAVTLMRGFGIRLWFFFQSLQQLKECYGERAATILDNIDTQQYFGINSYETAETLSKRIGDSTIRIESQGDSTSHSHTLPAAFAPNQPGSVSHGTSSNRSDIARKLLFPDEILGLPEQVALVFHRNLPVIAASTVRYYKDPEFSDYQRLSGSQSASGRARRGLHLSFPRLRIPVLPAIFLAGASFLVLSAYPPFQAAMGTHKRRALPPPARNASDSPSAPSAGTPPRKRLPVRRAASVTVSPPRFTPGE